ncbi:hypothetical protein MI302_02090 [Thermus sp. NEB1569]|nr:hypothetical protein MI302_02090 [Thermus sp. NEB1569]
MGEPGGRLPLLQPEEGGPHPRGGGDAPTKASPGAQGAPFSFRPEGGPRGLAALPSSLVVLTPSAAP